MREACQATCLRGCTSRLKTGEGINMKLSELICIWNALINNKVFRKFSPQFIGSSRNPHLSW